MDQHMQVVSIATCCPSMQRDQPSHPLSPTFLPVAHKLSCLSRVRWLFDNNELSSSFVSAQIMSLGGTRHDRLVQTLPACTCTRTCTSSQAQQGRRGLMPGTPAACRFLLDWIAWPGKIGESGSTRPGRRTQLLISPPLHVPSSGQRGCSEHGC